MDHLELQAEVLALERRIKFLLAIIRLAFLLVRLSGFRLDTRHVPDGATKRSILEAIAHATKAIPLAVALRVLRPRCPSPRSHPRRLFPDGGDERKRVWPPRRAIIHNHRMVSLFVNLLGALRSALRTRADLALENLALRQQLANFKRTSGRPRLRKSDRAFWLVLSRLWSRWVSVLVIVKPDTVARWHRAGFRLFWRWKSRPRTAGAR